MAELTPEEQTYQQQLSRLYEAMRIQSADPGTPIHVREDIQPWIAAVATQLDEIEGGLFHRGTVELQAAADGMAPAMKRLHDLKAGLDHLSAQLTQFKKIAGYAQQAINALAPLVTA